VAVRAVRYLNLLHARCIPLKVVGHYSDAGKSRLLRLAGQAEGVGFLEFCAGVSDEELALLYESAGSYNRATHIEGFSLPVVEASMCGCPVVASTCAAQMELIEQPEALFHSDDAVVLAEKLDAFLNQPALRERLVAAQAHLGPKVHEDGVGERFWKPLTNAVEMPGGAVPMRRKKPNIAFLGPFPPDQS
jgi:glycosyltransferase involved in cell wall biosynthesis